MLSCGERRRTADVALPPERDVPDERLDRSRDQDRGGHALRSLRTWLTRCAHEGCHGRSTRLGWCDEHAPAYEPGPDEYWG